MSVRHWSHRPPGGLAGGQRRPPAGTRQRSSDRSGLPLAVHGNTAASLRRVARIRCSPTGPSGPKPGRRTPPRDTGRSRLRLGSPGLRRTPEERRSSTHGRTGAGPPRFQIMHPNPRLAIDLLQPATRPGGLAASGLEMYHLVPISRYCDRPAQDRGDAEACQDRRHQARPRAQLARLHAEPHGTRREDRAHGDHHNGHRPKQGRDVLGIRPFTEPHQPEAARHHRRQGHATHGSGPAGDSTLGRPA